MKKNNDKKIAIILAISLAFCLVLYGVNYFYQTSNGDVQTEYALKYTHKELLVVEGFAVRDENKTENSKNTSVLYKAENKVYLPVVSDGDNVAKNGVIAIAFDSQQQADNYIKVQELTEKINSVQELKNNKSLNHKNVLFLNSQINIDVREYARIISNGDLNELSAIAQDAAENMTAKQIAVGGALDFDSIINDYQKEIKQLKSTYSVNKSLTAPFAGYFVSEADGLESAVDYDSVKNKQISNGDGEKLKNTKPLDVTGVYGKLIAQHDWYYIFDADINAVSDLKTGASVTVSFEELGVFDIKMTVYDVSDLKDSVVTVTLKCTSMNEELSKIRTEKATIVTQKYTGLRIDSSAIRENEEGLKGVYVINGTFIRFAPLDVKYYGENYIIADSYTVPEGEEKKYYSLKEYDRVIVKGVNLEDGLIID